MTQLQTLTPYKATLFTASFSSKKMFSWIQMHLQIENLKMNLIQTQSCDDINLFKQLNSFESA